MHTKIGGTTQWEASGTTVWGRTPFGARARLFDVTGHSPANGVDGAAIAQAVTALPDTLAVCKELVRLWDAGIRPQIVQGGLREEVEFAELCMATARAAIAKAGGGA